MRDCIRENDKGRKAGGTEIVKTEIGGDKRERRSEHLCAQRDMGERDCGLFGGSFAMCYAVKPLDHGLR